MQEIIVVIIGILVLAIVIGKIYRFFFSHEEQGKRYGCSGCHCHTQQRKRQNNS